MKISMQNMAIDSFAPVLQSLSRFWIKPRRTERRRKSTSRTPGWRPTCTRSRNRFGSRALRLDCVARLTGKEPPLRAPSPAEHDEQTIGDLKTHIAKTIVTLASAEAADFEGSEDRDCSIEIPDGGGVIVMNGLQYLRSWALPHFYFHVVTAYDILRHHGVDLGKQDYMSHVGAFIRRSE